MEIPIILMAVLFVAAVVMIARMYQQLKRNAEIIREKEIELTTYVAENVDLKQQMEEIQHDYKLQKDMADEIVNMRQQSRTLKHDMKNHTLVILSYLEKNQIEEAKQYTSEILDKLNAMYTYISVGNALLNFIINSKLSKAKELGLEIKAEIENLPFSYMDSIDFSSLLSNILDNAMEAAVDSQRKMLGVTIAHKKGFDTIAVKNSIDQSVLERNPELKTSKAEKEHGLGIKQIRAIVEKYDGELDIYEEQGRFCVFVALPDKG